MPTALVDPARLTAAERLDEVARILAAGIRRARAKWLESQAESTDKEVQSSLDFTDKDSSHIHTKT